jgi:raffinose/stachyose/melibiose transport system permease protein
MALPAALLFGVFFVFPLVQGLGMSLTEWNGMGSPKFVGFRNFVDFFQDSRAIHDIQNTLRNCTEIT